MTTETTSTTRGLSLPCPCCGEGSANVDLHLADLTFTCCECNSDFTADDVRAFIAKWAPVLKWIEAAPAL